MIFAFLDKGGNIMEKRKLGKTGFEVTLIGFGGIPIQRLKDDEALRIIGEAVNQGINFIDTATGYGRSEELIGYGIEKYGRDKFYIATKSPVRDYDGMKKEINKSLKRLKTDVIDLYQLHNVRTEEQYNKVMGKDGALKALKEAKEEGKIKEIGITSHDLHILEKTVDTEEFSTIQFPYNPVERRGEDLFKKAKDLDIGVIVMKPVAGGAIKNVNLSLKFISENENVSVIIPGMDKVDQVIENSKVAKEFTQLTEEEKRIIDKEAKELGSEFCRRCGYCGPCPQGIDIPTQFILEGYYLRYDLEDWAKERYLGIDKKASDCIECGKCEPKCPYDLPIRDMLKRVSENLG